MSSDPVPRRLQSDATRDNDRYATRLIFRSAPLSRLLFPVVSFANALDAANATVLASTLPQPSSELFRRLRNSPEFNGNPYHRR